MYNCKKKFYRVDVIVLRFKNIIFDLDGTLVDSFQDIYISLTNAAEHLSLPAPSEIIMRNNLHLRLDQLVEAMYPDVDGNAVMTEFRNHYDSSGYTHTYPYPGVNETLQYLKEKGCHLFVATNKRKVAARAILRSLDLNNIIEDVYTSDCATHLLSKEKIVERLIAEKRLETKRTSLVGDTNSDLDAALYNNLFFIYAAYGYGKLDLNSMNESKTTHIGSFPQLIRLIE
jgi:phosphoglycolate phosphatase